MVDILHRVGIATASPAEVYSALTTVDGLAGWWAEKTEGTADRIGGLLQFRFDAGGFDISVLELEAERRVLWEVVEGPAEWVGTRIDWELHQDGEYVIVLFRHLGWREPVEFMHHCSTKWALFLMSLKSLVETGQGAPDPRDVKIDNWN